MIGVYARCVVFVRSMDRGAPREQPRDPSASGYDSHSAMTAPLTITTGL